MGMGERSYILNDPPLSKDVDLIPRIRQGIELAKKDGFEFVFVIEDDDFYRLDYFEQFGDIDGIDFVGYGNTTYYNLKNRTWQTFEHPTHSSLCFTGFRISALDKFVWPKDNHKFLDIKLWDYCFRYGKHFKLLHDQNPNIGIKHGRGLCGGKGHVMQMKNIDLDLVHLKSIVDESSFEFYKLLEL
jgi:hypothetical protein